MRETTKWTDVEYRVPNHIYFVENSKCHAYVKEGTNELIVFNKPIKFDVRRRTFAVKNNVKLEDYIN